MWSAHGGKLMCRLRSGCCRDFAHPFHARKVEVALGLLRVISKVIVALIATFGPFVTGALRDPISFEPDVAVVRTMEAAKLVRGAPE